MSATALSVPSLSILAPTAALPAEGLENVKPLDGQAGAAAFLSAYQGLVSSGAPVFVLKHGDISWEGDVEDLSTVQLIDVTRDGASGAVEIEERYAMSRINWGQVMSVASVAMSGEHFLPTPDEILRVFASAVRDAARETAAAFKGEAVPLLEIERDEVKETTRVRFLGICLADESTTKELHAGDSCVLLEHEVEGRGVKEAVMAAAMVAMVFQSTASAADVRAAPEPQKMSWFASLFGGGGGGQRAGKGEVLKVTSQRLVQVPPRIYRSVLDNPSAGPLKVVVDIGDQRAYLVRGGQVAFETPISTAMAGRWTPRGTFHITEKVKSGKMSTIYNCALPGWMRVGETAVGMHEGMLPGYPASHGCIRMPVESAYFIFDHAPSGTAVQIVDDWSPTPAAPAGVVVAQN